MRSMLSVSAFLAFSLPAIAQTPCGGVTGVTVSISPPVAAIGQMIEVSLTNNSGQMINLPSTCLFQAVYLNSTCAAPPAIVWACGAMITPIPPGESMTQAWSQKTTGGAQVPPGFYSVAIQYYDAAFNPFSCCVTGEISSAGSVYCTAKVNSCGTLPAMGLSGTPSATAGSGFTVNASKTSGTKCGLLLYGDDGPAQPPPPFSGGLLCVAPQVKRSVGVCDTTGTPGACDGDLAIDMNAFATGALGGNPLPSLLVPGTQINCQFWGRDTPGNSLLGDALQYVIGP